MLKKFICEFEYFYAKMYYYLKYEIKKQSSYDKIENLKNILKTNDEKILTDFLLKLEILNKLGSKLHYIVLLKLIHMRHVIDSICINDFKDYFNSMFKLCTSYAILNKVTNKLEPGMAKLYKSLRENNKKEFYKTIDNLLIDVTDQHIKTHIENTDFSNKKNKAKAILIMFEIQKYGSNVYNLNEFVSNNLKLTKINK